MKKVTLIILALGIGGMLAPVLFAEDKAKSSEFDLQTVKEDGKQLLKDIGTTAKKIGNTVGDTVNKGIQELQGTFLTRLAGEWQFENGNAVTYITIHGDGTMLVEQSKKKKTEKSWQGTCVVTSNTITFTPNNGKADWIIQYQLQNHKSEMQIKSESIPKDTNGYKFSNPTIFLKQ